MKLRRVALILGLLIFAKGTVNTVFAQTEDVYKKKGYVLKFTSNDANFNLQLKERMIKTFFQVYPKLAKDFNKNTLKEVTFVVDTAYKGVAATGGGRVVYSSNYMTTHSNDIDVVTHEVMHIVQAYPNGSGPWWVTEGIADYVRYKYGVDNKGGNWSLPDYKNGQKYTDSYRITARFFVWVEKQNPGFIKKLDKAMREKTYSAGIWQKETGKTIDELWDSYAANPMI